MLRGAHPGPHHVINKRRKHRQLYTEASQHPLPFLSTAFLWRGDGRVRGGKHLPPVHVMLGPAWDRRLDNIDYRRKGGAAGGALVVGSSSPLRRSAGILRHAGALQEPLPPRGLRPPLSSTGRQTRFDPLIVSEYLFCQASTAVRQIWALFTRKRQTQRCAMEFGAGERMG